MFIREIKDDFKSYIHKKPNFFNILIYFILNQNFKLICLYRIAHTLRKKNMRILSAITTRLIKFMYPVDIEVACTIGVGLKMPHPLCIVIGGKVKIGDHCKIMQGVSLGGSLGKAKPDGQTQPILGNNVFIGAGAKIIGPVIIGDNVIVGANSVVTKDIESNSNAYGIPARIQERDIKV